MYFAATPELTAAVSASGGFGFLPAGEFQALKREAEFIFTNIPKVSKRRDS